MAKRPVKYVFHLLFELYKFSDSGGGLCVWIWYTPMVMVYPRNTIQSQMCRKPVAKMICKKSASKNR